MVVSFSPINSSCPLDFSSRSANTAETEVRTCLNGVRSTEANLCSYSGFAVLMTPILYFSYARPLPCNSATNALFDFGLGQVTYLGPIDVGCHDTYGGGG